MSSRTRVVGMHMRRGINKSFVLQTVWGMWGGELFRGWELVGCGCGNSFGDCDCSGDCDSLNVVLYNKM